MGLIKKYMIYMSQNDHVDDGTGYGRAWPGDLVHFDIGIEKNICLVYPKFVRWVQLPYVMSDPVEDNSWSRWT